MLGIPEDIPSTQEWKITMKEPGVKVKVAVIQAASVFFNREACIHKAEALMAEAANLGVEVVLFPEAFIPAYPRGFSFGMVVGNRSLEGRRLWQWYWENAVPVPGPAMEKLGEAARQYKLYVVMGVVERDNTSSGGTLYCTTLYISPGGQLLGKHRKLKPTGSERLIWGEGDGSTLTVVETPKARVGGLICWENYMPLARMAMYRKGVEIYVAPTADSRDTWQSTLQHIACEGRCYVLGCNQYFHKSMLPEELRKHPEMSKQPEVMCRGGSVIVSPLGEVLAGPLYGEEGMLVAELDMDVLKLAKVDFDVVGHYARPDVFQFKVNESFGG
jgi:nitrilase